MLKNNVNLLRYIGLGGFGIAGVLYLTRSTVKDKFSKQQYYKEGIDLLKGYKPAVDRLGEPIEAGKVEVSDKFNLHNRTEARAKIPVKGKLKGAELLVYAKRPNEMEDWWIEKLEIAYPGTGLKYMFYDGALAKPHESERIKLAEQAELAVKASS